VIEALLREHTSLPDLHLALVHAPLVLAAAALLFDLWALAARATPGFRRSIVSLWAMAAVAAAAAYDTGIRAAEAGAARADAQLAAALAAHREAAFAALVALLAAAALRALAAWGDDSRPLRLLAGVAGPVALGLGLVAADSGSALVYRHAVAVTAAAAPECAGADCPLPTGDAGLLLPVVGRAELALAAVAGNRVEVRLDLAGFRGDTSLARRSADGASELRLRVAEDGAVALVLLREGREEPLAQAVRAPRPGPLGLALAPAGQSARGWVDGIGLDASATLALDGPATLVLEGNGEARILGLGPTAGALAAPALPAPPAGELQKP
jgi:uncharacterized membrane protein